MGRQSTGAAAILVAVVAAMTAAAAQQPALQAPDTVVHAGRLVDGVSSTVREGVSILIAGGHGDRGDLRPHLGPDPPIEAILSATRHAADLVGASAVVGSIQSGRFAGLIAVAGDPLKDVAELQPVIFVMKGGRVHKGAGRPGGPGARTSQ